MKQITFIKTGEGIIIKQKKKERETELFIHKNNFSYSLFIDNLKFLFEKE